MDALQFDLSTKKLKFVEIPVPKIQNDGDVLIRVHYSGICGTDLHIMQGEFPCKNDAPITLGHEFSGIVADVGKAVKNIKVGDKVGIDPNDGCHSCKVCRQANPHFCEEGGLNNTIGIFRNGGWAQYVLAPMEQVHKLPSAIKLEQAVLCEPISCIAHGYDLISNLKIGQDILITGAGIIGNLWSAVLHQSGHRRVTVSEPNLERLSNLKKLDLGYTLLAPDQLKKNQSADPEYLFDIVIDCSGFAPAVEHAISLLRKGGKIILFGVAPPHAKISITPYEFFKKELSLIGVNVNPFSFENAIGLVEAMGDRYLNHEKLGIKCFSLKDYVTAIEELKQGGISKAIFKVE